MNAQYLCPLVRQSEAVVLHTLSRPQQPVPRVAQKLSCCVMHHLLATSLPVSLPFSPTGALEFLSWSLLLGKEPKA